MNNSEIIPVETLMELRDQFPLIDVRAPVEFNQGHVSGANNIPLFNDEERARIGTLYKQQGRQKAIRLGLELVGPKMTGIVDRVDAICPDSPKEILVYCARGGMRSDSVCWLLRQADFRPLRLEGGYKSFRRYCHATLEKEWNLAVLTGMTGAGKTRLLKQLCDAGEQVLDLEGLANHRGSAFGGIGQDPQPNTEQFENLIFEELIKFDNQKRIWVEDESRSVGKCVVPQPFFDQLHGAPAIQINVEAQERAEFLVAEYGNLPVGDMVAAIERISKRLGGQNVKAAIDALHANDLQRCAEILLVYYDKTYEICRVKNPRKAVHPVDISGCDERQRLLRVIEAADHFLSTSNSHA